MFSEAAARAAFVKANTAIAAPPLVPEIRLHLAGEVTVLGHCDDLELVARLADRVASGDRAERLESIAVAPH